MSASPVARDLAAGIAPALRAELAAREEAIIRDAGGLAARAAVRLSFPVLLREIPTLLEIGVDALLDGFGRMRIEEVAALLLRHARAKGRDDDPVS